MRKKMITTSFGTLLLSIAFSGSSVSAQRAPEAAPQFQAPSDEAQLMMIRSTLIALNQANQTNNYTVLSGLASPAFQKKNPPKNLSEAFQSFRANNIDLTPVMLLMPQLNQKATVADNKLRFVGLFPSQPMQVNFDLTYEPVSGQWKLLNLAVNLRGK